MQDTPAPSWPLEPPQSRGRGLATSKTLFALHWLKGMHLEGTTERPYPFWHSHRPSIVGEACNPPRCQNNRSSQWCTFA